MNVREWDPRTAPDAEMGSFLDTLNAVLAADLPADPPWRVDLLRGYLAEVMPGERRISWVAEDDSGGIVGYVNVLLLGDIGVLDLMVHPTARRAKLGRQLLGMAARRTLHEGFCLLGVEVAGDTPAVGFYGSLGFTREYVEIRSVLPLSCVDWARVTRWAAEVGDGYRVEFWPGGPPDELVESYARLKAEYRDIGREDDSEPELRPSSYDPQRLRDSLDCLHRRGMKPYIVSAIHEATGTVAGLTEVVVPAQHPSRADQYDTIVGQHHRGYGIDRAIKSRMLLELRSAEPGLAEVQTWNAPANEVMIQVNADLGFRAERDWCEYGIEVAHLVHRLDNGG